MSFNIYFDESHKIDKYTSNYAYYGILGLDDIYIKEIIQLAEANKIYGELHFADFNLDKIDKYMELVLFVLENAKVNIYIVNTDEAFKMRDNEEELRKGFYAKIPERLIYGMTREIKKNEKVNIYIDKSTDYGSDSDSKIVDDDLSRLLKDFKDNLDLLEEEINKKFQKINICKVIKEQLNSQALYRGLNYLVNNVKQKDSKEDKCLQVVDVILGCIVFLFEENYYEIQGEISYEKYNNAVNNELLTPEEKDFVKKIFDYNSKTNSYIFNVKQNELITKNKVKDLNKKLKLYSQQSVQKSEFIYKILSQPKYLDRFQKFNIFIWGEEVVQDIYSNNYKKEINKFNISKYISKFLDFKYKYDNEKRLEILKIYLCEGKDLRYGEKDYRQKLNFGTGLKRLIRRYIEELEL